jgi:hypothetical protein
VKQAFHGNLMPVGEEEEEEEEEAEDEEEEEEEEECITILYNKVNYFWYL